MLHNLQNHRFPFCFSNGIIKWDKSLVTCVASFLNSSSSSIYTVSFVTIEKGCKRSRTHVGFFRVCSDINKGNPAGSISLSKQQAPAILWALLATSWFSSTAMLSTMSMYTVAKITKLKEHLHTKSNSKLAHPPAVSWPLCHHDTEGKTTAPLLFSPP